MSQLSIGEISIKDLCSEKMSSLQMGSKGITDLHIDVITLFLKSNDKLTLLNLENNKITDEGIIALSDELQTNTRLTVLNLANNNISDDGARILAEGLDTNTVLKVLNVRGNWEMYGSGTEDLAASAMKSRRLKIFNGISLGQLRKNNKNTVAHNFSEIKMGDAGAYVLAMHMKISTSLTKLNLEMNQIGDEGMQFIGNILKNHRIKVNSNMGVLIHKTVSYPGQKIGQILEYGKIVSYDQTATYNHLGHPITFYRLSDGRGWIHNYIASDPKGLNGVVVVKNSLSELCLKCNRIGNVGAHAIGEVLKNNSTLRELNLDTNCIGSVGAKAISAGIETNNALTKLWLGQGNNIGDIGISSIANFLISNGSLRDLRVSQNAITCHGAKAIGNMMKKKYNINNYASTNEQY